MVFISIYILINVIFLVGKEHTRRIIMKLSLILVYIPAWLNFLITVGVALHGFFFYFIVIVTEMDNNHYDLSFIPLVLSVGGMSVSFY